MPAVVRVGDSLSTGHGCAGSTTLASANQGSVYANGILVAVVGAPTVSHKALRSGGLATAPTQAP